MPLNSNQQAAVEYLSGPLLVLAGPGTGKTQLLSHKVAYILKHTDASPENILCITFTDAATANMRERLTSIIGTAAHHVNISTYHAFGADLLQQYKNYAATFTRELNNPIDDVTAHKIITELKQTLSPLDPLNANSVKDILDTISSAKKARLTPEDLITISKANQTSGAAFTPPISELLQPTKGRSGLKYDSAYTSVYLPILEILTEYISSNPIVGQVEPLANCLARDLKAAIDGEKDNAKPSIQPLTKWRNKYFELTPDDSFRLKDYIANRKLASLAQIYQAYQDYLTAGGLYDFDDMIEEAIHTLKTDEGFRLSLSEKYQYILLDEFQDTNPSQFEIIKLLTSYEKPCLMAVGDDDQTIFEFQGARPDNLIEFQKLYQAKVIHLTENYRSTTEIVNLGRQIATQIPDSFEKIMHTPKQLTAVRDAELSAQANPQLQVPDVTPPTYIHRYEFTSTDGEYAWLAAHIQQLIQQGESPSTIGIITPQHKFLQPLLPYLKDQNIPITYEKSENILENPQIKHLTTLAEFIYDLSQANQPAHKLLEILSYPFWELPATVTIQNIQKEDHKPTLDYLLKAPDQQLQTIGALLAELVTRSATAPLEQFLDYLIGTLPLSSALTSPFLNFYSHQDEYTAFTLYNNLLTLREKLTAHLHVSSPNLADFITFLQDYANAGVAITTTSPYQDNENSVHLMTVHKSKGLEFKHVYLIAVDDNNWGNASGNRNLLSLPKNLLFLRQDGTSESELLRKFFVAITRAETYLTITNSAKNYTGKTPPRLEYLQEYTADDGQIISPLLPSGHVTPLHEDIDAAKTRTDLHLSWLAHYFTPVPDIRPTLLQRLAHYRLSPTDLTNFIDIIYGGPAEFYKNKVLRAPKPPDTANLRLGNLVHAAFEKVTKEGITDAEALAFCQEQLATLPITEAEKAELSELSTASLTASLQQFAPILRHPHSQAELSFRPEHLALNDIPLDGKIDHLNIDDTQKTIEVYDFKTSKYISDKWQNKKNTLYKYKLQLGFYKLLLNLSPTYAKYKVTTGHILFVKPDEYGEVHDKVYQYNQADEDTLIRLIQIVYHHIKTLDFLENSSLNLEPDPTRSDKDFFNFVELLLNSDAE